VRAPSGNEKALIEVLLSEDGPGVLELRAQVASVRVLGPWSPGSASLRLVVNGNVPPGAVSDGPAGSGWAYALSGEPLGTVLLWVTDGYLSDLEYGWVTGEAPTELPSADSVRVP